MTNQDGARVADLSSVLVVRNEVRGVSGARDRLSLPRPCRVRSSRRSRRLTLALYCGASGDHNPLHVDIDFARAAGLDDVIAHGMLAMAYLGRFLTDSLPTSQPFGGSRRGSWP